MTVPHQRRHEVRRDGEVSDFGDDAEAFVGQLSADLPGRAVTIMFVAMAWFIWLTVTYTLGTVQRKFEVSNLGVAPWIVLAWLLATASVAAAITVSYHRARRVLGAVDRLLGALVALLLIVTIR